MFFFLRQAWSQLFERSEAEGRSELGIGLAKKKVNKKKGTTTSSNTTNFVPGQTIHFLVEVFAFLSLFQPPKTFSYVFHFHNLSKRHSEKTIFTKKFFWKKKNQKKLFKLTLMMEKKEHFVSFFRAKRGRRRAKLGIGLAKKRWTKKKRC